MRTLLIVAGRLTVSKVFMALAWYGHLINLRCQAGPFGSREKHKKNPVADTGFSAGRARKLPDHNFFRMADLFREIHPNQVNALIHLIEFNFNHAGSVFEILCIHEFSCNIENLHRDDGFV